MSMTDKFDEDAHTGLVSILFTRLKCDVHKDRNKQTLHGNNNSHAN